MFTRNTQLLQMVLQLLATAIAGVIIGVPYSNRPGGIRVHALVSAGATLFCALALHSGGQQTIDLSRVIQGLIQGVGFIGAATVIKYSGYIVGINTAASILLAAAIGCYIGIGQIIPGLVLAFIVTGLNLLLKRIEAHSVQNNAYASSTEKETKQ
jgi:putative Mg2+ transporter-C (MgtC) family protein